MSVRAVTQWSRTDFQLNLKLAVARFKLKRTKLSEGLRTQRKSIESDLLEGQDRAACAKTITLIRDEYLIEVLNILEIYCETLHARQAIIDGSQTCPADLQIQVCSILFAAQHVNIPELTNVKKLLFFKFGRPLLCHCADLNCIHPQVRGSSVDQSERGETEHPKMKEYLSTARPPAKIINYHLKMIGKKIGVEVDLLPEDDQPVPLNLRQGNMNGPASPVPVKVNDSSTPGNPTPKVEAGPSLLDTYRPTVLSPKTQSDLLRFEDTPEAQQLKTRFSSLLLQTSEGSRSTELYAESSSPQRMETTVLSNKQHGALSSGGALGAHDTKSLHADIRSDSTTNGDHDTIILSVGSGNIRAGFADEREPSVVVPTVVGFPLGEKVIADSEALEMVEDMFVGDDAIRKRGILELIYPIQAGRVHHWNLLPPLWRHVFRRLNVDPNKHPITLCVPEYLSQEDVDGIRNHLHELGCTSLMVHRDPVAVVQACQMAVGLVVDCGTSTTRVAPVLEGQLVTEACTRFVYGGSQADFYFSRLLQERGINLTTSAELHIVEEMKEKIAFVSLDYNNEAEEEVVYTLPDEQTIRVGKERCQVGEAFFHPTLLGVEERGLHHLILRTLLKCPPSARQTLLSHIIIVGGTSYLPHFTDRLGKELASLVPRGAVIKLHVLPNRDNLVWLGAKSLK